MYYEAETEWICCTNTTFPTAIFKSPDRTFFNANLILGIGPGPGSYL